MSDHEIENDAAETLEPAPTAPAGDREELEALRARAEGAERKLREIQSSFTHAKAELDATRVRLERDLERKVQLRFGELVGDLLECADDLDRAIEHGGSIAAARPVVDGVSIARDRFLTALTKAGLERIDPLGDPYDPNVAEAIGVLPVERASEGGVVVRVERPGYRLGSRVIRPARVLVGQVVS